MKIYITNVLCNVDDRIVSRRRLWRKWGEEKMNELQIFNNPELGEVRVIGDFENPRFCLSDVCKILEIGNPSQAKARLDKGVITNETLQTAGGMQTLTFVNEDGLYDLILDSRKPAAKKLRKWLTSEVVPSIRKTGMYIDPSRPISGDQLILIGQRMKELENQVAELKPHAEYCRRILRSPDAIPVTLIAKDYGMSAEKFNALLHKLKIQYPMGKTWALFQDYADKGYTITQTKLIGELKTVVYMQWTQKGRLFLYEKLKKNGTLPICEQAHQIALPL